MTDKTIIEWEKKFDKYFRKDFQDIYTQLKDWSILNMETQIKDFIKEQLTLAERRGEEKAQEEKIEIIKDCRSVIKSLYGVLENHGVDMVKNQLRLQESKLTNDINYYNKQSQERKEVSILAAKKKPVKKGKKK